jgi:hypothetical protein
MEVLGNAASLAEASAGHRLQRLFREQLASGDKRLEGVFAAMQAQGEQPLNYYEDQRHHLRSASYAVDRVQGEGIWHLLSAGQDLYVATTDACYDQPCFDAGAGRCGRS